MPHKTHNIYTTYVDAAYIQPNIYTTQTQHVQHTRGPDWDLQDRVTCCQGPKVSTDPGLWVCPQPQGGQVHQCVMMKLMLTAVLLLPPPSSLLPPPSRVPLTAA